MSDNIIVFCAHPDDEVIGVGGTIAKYASQGKEIHTVIFSYGEKSHPWIKEKYTIETRVNESKKASKIIGTKDIKFFGLEEGKFTEQFNDKNLKDKVINMIKDLNPSKIFTHSIDEIHPDHTAVFNLIYEILKEIKFDGELLLFDVWNPHNIRKRHKPKLYVDISDTFEIKLEALKCFQSQKIQALIPLTWSIYLRAIIHGIGIKKKFSERFYKIH